MYSAKQSAGDTKNAGGINFNGIKMGHLFLQDTNPISEQDEHSEQDEKITDNDEKIISEPFIPNDIQDMNKKNNPLWIILILLFVVCIAVAGVLIYKRRKYNSLK
jgi:hypothetical protein